MRYIKRLSLALAAAMLITLVGCNAAVTSPAHTDDVLVAVPERTHTPEAVLTPAPTPEPEPTEEPTPSPTPDDGLPYYLYVEKGSFTLTIYEKDENGEYTKVYKAYRIAHGGNKTPAGTYTLGGEEARERWHDFRTAAPCSTPPATKADCISTPRFTQQATPRRCGPSIITGTTA